MENQPEKKMGNEMETGIIRYFIDIKPKSSEQGAASRREGLRWLRSTSVVPENASRMFTWPRFGLDPPAAWQIAGSHGNRASSQDMY